MSDTPLTDKRCDESQKLQSMATRFAWMCDHARRLERKNTEINHALNVARLHAEVMETALRKIVIGGYIDGADRAHPAIAVARAALAEGGAK